MSVEHETLLAIPFLETSSEHLDDADWLRSLQFRSGARKELAQSAAKGDVERFGAALGSAFDRFGGLRKSERQHVREQLLALWEPMLLNMGTGQPDVASLAACLFSRDSEEVCGRVEAIIASHTEDVPEHDTLIAALWLLQLRSRDLAPRTLQALWRWSLQSARAFLAHAGSISAESGFAHLRVLEVQLMSGEAAAVLKGARKLVRSAMRGFRDAVEAATDTDGTPHARVLPDLLGSLACLGRVSMFMSPGNDRPWDKSSRVRLEGLFERSLTLFSPRHQACAPAPIAPEMPDDETSPPLIDGDSSSHSLHRLQTLQAIADTFGIPSKAGVRKLLRQWEAELQQFRKPGKPRVSHWSLPDECHQSDWAEWCCLRSGWEGTADRVILTHDALVPRLDVLVRGVPLFSGPWEHALSVDGRPLPSEEGWSCVCWFNDDEAAFVELQQQINSSTRVIRQACLVRHERLLLLADSIRCDRAERIDYLRSLPLATNWRAEYDAATREAALQSEQDHGHRVRIFPLSTPQERVVRGDETISVAEGQFLTRHVSGSSQAYVATAFDWSEKRRERPVDWNRLTVAEDGQILPASVAVAFRLRTGQRQWFLYHSQVPPQVPRTALGIHTSCETVFGRFTSTGDFEPLVEVEI